jgi:hypothetical protein
MPDTISAPEDCTMPGTITPDINDNYALAMM